MLNSQIFSLRSGPISGKRLLEVVRHVGERFATLEEDFEKIDAASGSCSLKLHELPSLDAFGDISDAYGVTIMTGTSDVQQLSAFLSMTRETYAESLQHAWTTWYGCESVVALQGKKRKISAFSPAYARRVFFVESIPFVHHLAVVT